MSEKEYKKNKFGYDKEFNNSKEYMQEFKPATFERKPTKWDDLVDFFDAPHTLSRGAVVFVAASIIYLATPEFAKFIVQSGVPAFLKYYGAAIIAGAALFVLTRSDRH
jgi:hypothetical protein